MSHLKSINAFEEKTSCSPKEGLPPDLTVGSNPTSSHLHADKADLASKTKSYLVPHHRSPHLESRSQLDLIPEEAPNRFISTYEEL
eukprot:634913-Hanusia_phi.AAC.1